MHIVVVNQFYWPSICAAAQILTDLCESIVAAGHSVTVVCSQGDYTGKAARLPARDRHEGVEILGWKEAVDDLYEFTEVDRATNNKFMFIIGFIGALVILNVILMSVMERMREFGVMLALGMTPGRLRRLILTEGLVLGLASRA